MISNDQNFYPSQLPFKNVLYNLVFNFILLPKILYLTQHHEPQYLPSPSVFLSNQNILMHFESNFTNETHIWNKKSNQTSHKNGELRSVLQKQNHHTNTGSTIQIPQGAFHLTSYTILFALILRTASTIV